ncbi:cysteine-rich VLP protein [Halobacillus sp. H74]|uniref:cysteine-rich VLP protein n=1 Tax=Halobacillus sp. H74 TaxID=3457436 RepID=UPI003FCD167A
MLDRTIHANVKQLVKRRCASYSNGRCLLYDTSCDYESRFGHAVSCDYFEKSVLPNDEVLEARYKKAHGINYQDDLEEAKNIRKCTDCSEAFMRKSNRQTRCTECQRNANRKAKAERMRKYRDKASNM